MIGVTRRMRKMNDQVAQGNIPEKWRAIYKMLPRHVAAAECIRELGAAEARIARLEAALRKIINNDYEAGEWPEPVARAALSTPLGTPGKGEK